MLGAVEPQPARFTERGAGALALLASLLVMGAMAVIVLTALPGGGANVVTPPGLPVVTPGTQTRHGPTADPALGDIQAAAIVVCETDYQAVAAAVSYYQAEKGSLPTSMGPLRPLLRSPVASLYFTIAIDAHRPGVVEVSTNGHPPTPGEGNCAFAG
jgi:hypothetical protein